MSLIPNASWVNPTTELWKPNQTIQATNIGVTSGAISLGQTSSILFKSTFTNNPNLSYLSYVNGAVQLSNIGGAGSNMLLQLVAQDPNGYIVSAPAQTITGSNSTAFDFTLPFVGQSANTQLKLNLYNSGSSNTGTATVTLYTNSMVTALGEAPSSANFFQ